MKLNIAPRGSTAGERFIRSIGLILVFALVGYAFWINTQRNLERLQTRNAVWDETGVLSKPELKYFKAFSRSMQERFGVKTVIHVRKNEIERGNEEENEVFIGLCPSKKQVVLQFPGLIRHALGNKLVESLENKYFADSFNGDDWVVALQTSVASIWEKLVEVETESELDAAGNKASNIESTPVEPQTQNRQE